MTEPGRGLADGGGEERKASRGKDILKRYQLKKATGGSSADLFSPDPLPSAFSPSSQPPSHHKHLPRPTSPGASSTRSTYSDLSRGKADDAMEVVGSWARSLLDKEERLARALNKKSASQREAKKRIAELEAIISLMRHEGRAPSYDRRRSLQQVVQTHSSLLAELSMENERLRNETKRLASVISENRENLRGSVVADESVECVEFTDPRGGEQGGRMRFSKGVGGGAFYTKDSTARPVFHKARLLAMLEFPDIGKGVMLPPGEITHIVPSLQRLFEQSGVQHDLGKPVVDRLADLEGQVAQYIDDRARHESKQADVLRVCQSAPEELIAENRRLTANIKELHEQLERRATLDGDRETAIATLQEQLSRSTEEIKALRQRVFESESRMRDREAELTQATGDLGLQERCLALGDQYVDVINMRDKQLQWAAVELEIVSNDRNALRVQLEEAERLLEAANSRNTMLMEASNEGGALRERLEEVEKLLENATSRNTDLMEGIEKYSSMLVRVQDTVDTQGALVKSLLDSAESRASDGPSAALKAADEAKLLEECKKLAKINDDQKAQIEALTSRMDGAQDLLSRANERIKEMQGELDQREEMESRRHAMETSRAALHDQQCMRYEEYHALAEKSGAVFGEHCRIIDEQEEWLQDLWRKLHEAKSCNEERWAAYATQMEEVVEKQRAVISDLWEARSVPQQHDMEQVARSAARIEEYARVTEQQHEMIESLIRERDSMMEGERRARDEAAREKAVLEQNIDRLQALATEAQASRDEALERVREMTSRVEQCLGANDLAGKLLAEQEGVVAALWQRGEKAKLDGAAPLLLQAEDVVMGQDEVLCQQEQIIMSLWATVVQQKSTVESLTGTVHQQATALERYASATAGAEDLVQKQITAVGDLWDQLRVALNKAEVQKDVDRLTALVERHCALEEKCLGLVHEAEGTSEALHDHLIKLRSQLNEAHVSVATMAAAAERRAEIVQRQWDALEHQEVLAKALWKSTTALERHTQHASECDHVVAEQQRIIESMWTAVSGTTSKSGGEGERWTALADATGKVVEQQNEMLQRLWAALTAALEREASRAVLEEQRAALEQQRQAQCDELLHRAEGEMASVAAMEEKRGALGEAMGAVVGKYDALLSALWDSSLLHASLDERRAALEAAREKAVDEQDAVLHAMWKEMSKPSSVSSDSLKVDERRAALEDKRAGVVEEQDRLLQAAWAALHRALPTGNSDVEERRAALENMRFEVCEAQEATIKSLWTVLTSSQPQTERWAVLDEARSEVVEQQEEMLRALHAQLTSSLCSSREKDTKIEKQTAMLAEYEEMVCSLTAQLEAALQHCAGRGDGQETEERRHALESARAAAFEEVEGMLQAVVAKSSFGGEVPQEERRHALEESRAALCEDLMGMVESLRRTSVREGASQGTLEAEERRHVLEEERVKAFDQLEGLLCALHKSSSSSHKLLDELRSAEEVTDRLTDELEAAQTKCSELSRVEEQRSALEKNRAATFEGLMGSCEAVLLREERRHAVEEMRATAFGELERMVEGLLARGTSSSKVLDELRSAEEVNDRLTEELEEVKGECERLAKELERVQTVEERRHALEDSRAEAWGKLETLLTDRVGGGGSAQVERVAAPAPDNNREAAELGEARTKCIQLAAEVEAVKALNTQLEEDARRMLKNEARRAKLEKERDEMAEEQQQALEDALERCQGLQEEVARLKEAGVGQSVLHDLATAIERRDANESARSALFEQQYEQIAALWEHLSLAAPASSEANRRDREGDSTVPALLAAGERHLALQRGLEEVATHQSELLEKAVTRHSPELVTRATCLSEELEVVINSQQQQLGALWESLHEKERELDVARKELDIAKQHIEDLSSDATRQIKLENSRSQHSDEQANMVARQSEMIDKLLEQVAHLREARESSAEALEMEERRASLEETRANTFAKLESVVDALWENRGNGGAGEPVAQLAKLEERRAALFDGQEGVISQLEAMLALCTERLASSADDLECKSASLRSTEGSDTPRTASDASSSSSSSRTSSSSSSDTGTSVSSSRETALKVVKTAFHDTQRLAAALSAVWERHGAEATLTTLWERVIAEMQLPPDSGDGLREVMEGVVEMVHPVVAESCLRSSERRILLEEARSEAHEQLTALLTAAHSHIEALHAEARAREKLLDEMQLVKDDAEEAEARCDELEEALKASEDALKATEAKLKATEEELRLVLDQIATATAKFAEAAAAAEQKHGAAEGAAQAKVDALQRQLAEANIQRIPTLPDGDITAEAERLRHELAAAQLQSEQLSSQLEEVRREATSSEVVARLEANLAEATRRVQRSEANCSASEEALHHAQEQLLQVEEAVRELEAKLAVAQAKSRERVEEEVSRYKEEACALRNSMAKLEAELVLADERIAELEGEEEGADESRKRTRRTEVSSFRKQRDAFDESLGRSKKAILEKLYKAYDQLKEGEQRAVKLERLLREKEGLLEAEIQTNLILETKLSEAVRERRMLETKMMQSRSVQQSALEDKQRVQEEYGKLQQRIAELETEAEEAQVKRQQLETSLARERQQFEQRTAMLEGVKKVATEKADRLVLERDTARAELQKHLDSVKAKRGGQLVDGEAVKFETEIAQLKRDVDSARKRANEAEEARLDADMLASRLRKQLNEEKEALRKSTACLEATKDELLHKQVELELAQKKLANLPLQRADSGDGEKTRGDEKVVKALKERITTLQNSLDIAKKQNREVEAQLTESQARITKLLNEQSHARSAFSPVSTVPQAVSGHGSQDRLRLSRGMLHDADRELVEEEGGRLAGIIADALRTASEQVTSCEQLKKAAKLESGSRGEVLTRIAGTAEALIATISDKLQLGEPYLESFSSHLTASLTSLEHDLVGRHLLHHHRTHWCRGASQALTLTKSCARAMQSILSDVRKKSLASLQHTQQSLEAALREAEGLWPQHELSTPLPYDFYDSDAESNGVAAGDPSREVQVLKAENRRLYRLVKMLRDTGDRSMCPSARAGLKQVVLGLVRLVPIPPHVSRWGTACAAVRCMLRLKHERDSIVHLCNSNARAKDDSSDTDASPIEPYRHSRRAARRGTPTRHSLSTPPANRVQRHLTYKEERRLSVGSGGKVRRMSQVSWDLSQGAPR